MNRLSSSAVMGAMALVAGCSSATAHTSHPAATAVPAACTDSLYVRLARVHPDSMSERTWSRFRSLDSACVRARSQVPSESHGAGMMGMGMGMGRAWEVIAPLIVVVMVVAMLALRL